MGTFSMRFYECIGGYKKQKPLKSYDLRGFSEIWVLYGRDDWIRTSGPYVPNVVR